MWRYMDHVALPTNIYSNHHVNAINYHIWEAYHKAITLLGVTKLLRLHSHISLCHISLLMCHHSKRLIHNGSILMKSVICMFNSEDASAKNSYLLRYLDMG